MVLTNDTVTLTKKEAAGLVLGLVNPKLDVRDKLSDENGWTFTSWVLPEL